jgi:hypothetical protein
MNFHNLLLSLGVGTAVLALWFVVRFPDKTPESFAKALMHVIAALMMGPMTPKLFAAVWYHQYAGPMAAIFAVLVPILFYTFLSGAWFIKLATENLARYRT